MEEKDVLTIPDLVPMEEKDVYTIPDLVARGYPKGKLREVSRSEDLWRCGFRNGRVAFFFKDKLDEELLRREKLGI